MSKRIHKAMSECAHKNKIILSRFKIIKGYNKGYYITIYYCKSCERKHYHLSKEPNWK